MALNYSLVRTQEPAPLVSVEDLAEHVRSTSNQDDAYLHDLAAAAVEILEERTSLSFMPQQWQLEQNRYSNPFELVRAPVASIESFQALDNDLVWQDVPAEDYTLDTSSNPALLYLNPGSSWPVKKSGLRTVRIVYNTGSTSPPITARQFVRLTVGHWFENRESVIVGTTAMEVPQSAAALLQHLRTGLWP